MAWWEPHREYLLLVTMLSIWLHAITDIDVWTPGHNTCVRFGRTPAPKEWDALSVKCHIGLCFNDAIRPLVRLPSISVTRSYKTVRGQWNYIIPVVKFCWSFSFAFAVAKIKNVVLVVLVHAWLSIKESAGRGYFIIFKLPFYKFQCKGNNHSDSILRAGSPLYQQAQALEMDIDTRAYLHHSLCCWYLLLLDIQQQAPLSFIAQNRRKELARPYAWQLA